MPLDPKDVIAAGLMTETGPINLDLKVSGAVTGWIGEDPKKGALDVFLCPFLPFSLIHLRIELIRISLTARMNDKLRRDHRMAMW